MFAQHRACADVHICADFAAGGHAGGRVYHGGGMDACLSYGRGVEQPCHLGEVKIGVGGDNQVAIREKCGGFLRNDNCACLAVLHFAFVFGVGEKGDFMRLGTGGGGDGSDDDVVADKFAAELGGKLGEGELGHGSSLRVGLAEWGFRLPCAFQRQPENDKQRHK